VRLFAIVALLAACGDDAATVDGGAVDADPNVRGTVTVHVDDKNNWPIAGLDVAFIDTDGTLTRTQTDDGGDARASVFPNASVTVLREDSSMQGYSLTTVQALHPGDVVTLVSAPSAASPGQDTFNQREIPLASMDITSATKSGSIATFATLSPGMVPVIGGFVIVTGVNPAGYNGVWQVASQTSTGFTANIGGGGLANGSGGLAAPATRFSLSYPTASGATGYVVYTSCGATDVGNTTTPQLTLRTACAGATTDIAVVAKGATMYLQQAAVPTTGTTNITDTWHALATVNATLTNPTPLVSEVEIDRFVPYARGAAVATASGIAGASTMLSLSTPLAPRAVMQTHLRCPEGGSCLSTATGTAQQTNTQIVDGTQTSFALDIGANLLPWVKASYDPTTTTLNMTVDGTTPIDLYEAHLRYSRGQVIYTWRVFGAVPQAFKFPTLPSDYPGDPTVRPTDAQGIYGVILCETDALDGYRAAIKNPYVSLGTCEASASVTSRPLATANSRTSQWN
jgi:hypothetical protein